MIGQSEGSERERSLLSATAAILSADLPLDRLFERLCRAIAAYVDAPFIYFAIVRRTKQHGDNHAYAYRCGVGRVRDFEPASRPDSRRALATQSSIMRSTGPNGEPRSTMTIPIHGGGTVHALLILEADRAAAFQSEDLSSLEAVARFVGVALRTRRLVGVTRPLQSTPALAGVIISALVFASFFLTFFFTAKGADARRHALASERARTFVVRQQLDSTLLVALQAARSATNVLAPIRSDRGRMETTLYHLLTSTPSSTIYGMGAWFEPYAFDPGRERFAPYVHRRPGKPDIITYRFQGPAYAYLAQDWYRDAERALGNPIFAPPRVQDGVALDSVVQGFYDRGSGAFSGVVSVDLGLRLLRSIVARLNEPGRLIYVTQADGTPLIFPQDAQLVAYANARNIRAHSVLDLDAATVHDYITDVLGKRRFEFTLPIRLTGWVVHASTVDDKLYADLDTLRNSLSEWLVAVWVLCGAALLVLRVIYLHAHRAMLVEVEKMHLVNESVRRERRLHKLEAFAYVDGLTGLANRARVVERIEELLRDPARGTFAVLALDLDRLSSVNERYGRNTGDRLLVTVGERLRPLVPEPGIVGRIGGDDFIAIVPSCDAAAAADLARAMIARLMEPVGVGEFEIASPAQVGIVIGPGTYADPVDVLRDADIAMDAARRSGERWRVFDRELADRLADDLALERELRRALDRSELRLYLQPIVALGEGHHVCGFESLVRWHHPTRGILPPGRFLPIAERAGLLGGIGEWAVGEAARLRASLAREAKAEPDLYVSVNLAAEQFGDRRLATLVREAVERNGISAATLKLELTEGTLLEENDTTRALLDELAAFGVCAHLDDFGTGYSSLGYLLRFPLETLKIDQSFVRQISTNAESREIVRTIVSLAQTLGLKVTAEGIETSDQLAALREFGVEQGQGYLFGYPEELGVAIERLLEAAERASA